MRKHLVILAASALSLPVLGGIAYAGSSPSGAKSAVRPRLEVRDRADDAATHDRNDVRGTGADDPANHEVNDDRGVDVTVARPTPTSTPPTTIDDGADDDVSSTTAVAGNDDDPAGHDAVDDHGGRGHGPDDPATHDAGDDHGGPSGRGGSNRGHR